MSTYALTEAWDSSVEDVPCRFVLVALACQANDEYVAWPSMDTLALRTGLHRRTVQRAITRLIEEGHVSYADGAQSLGGRSGQTTKYLIHPKPCPVRTGKKEARQQNALLRGGAVPPVGVADSTLRGGSQYTRGGTVPRVGVAANTPGVAANTPGGGTVPPEPSENLHRTSTEVHRQGLEAPCSEVEAFEFARNLPVIPPWTEQMVGHWYADREFRQWHTSGDNPQPITRANWRHDLRRSHRWAQLAAMHDRSLPAGGSPISEKKFRAAPAAAPEWDWKAAYRDRFDAEPPAEWAQLHPDIQRELEAMRVEGRAA